MNLDKLKNALKSDAAISAITTLILMLIFQIGFKVSMTDNIYLYLFFATLAAVLGELTGRMRRRFVNRLTNRIQSKVEKTWAVTLNDVTIGTLADSEYAAICLRVFQDKRVYLAQAANIVKCLLGLLNQFILAVPVFSFWLLLLIAFAEPETFTAVIAALQKQGSAMTVIFYAKQLLYVSVVMFVMGVCLSSILAGKKFGFVDCFEAAINKALRMHFKAEAEGNFCLMLWSASYCGNGVSAMNGGVKS